MTREREIEREREREERETAGGQRILTSHESLIFSLLMQLLLISGTESIIISWPRYHHLYRDKYWVTYWAPPGCDSARWESGCCWADRSTPPRPWAAHRAVLSHSRYIWKGKLCSNTDHFMLLSSWPVDQPVLVVDLDGSSRQQAHSILPGNDVRASERKNIFSFNKCSLYQIKISRYKYWEAYPL